MPIRKSHLFFTLTYISSKLITRHIECFIDSSFSSYFLFVFFISFFLSFLLSWFLSLFFFSFLPFFLFVLSLVLPLFPVFCLSVCLFVGSFDRLFVRLFLSFLSFFSFLFSFFLSFLNLLTTHLAFRTTALCHYQFFLSCSLIVTLAVSLQKNFFQDDVFPQTRVKWQPSMSVDEWVGGANTPQERLDLRPSDMEPRQ